VAEDDDVAVCGWVYLFVRGATQAPQPIYFLMQRHHRLAALMSAGDNKASKMINTSDPHEIQSATDLT